jgi:hypothetical protein
MSQPLTLQQRFQAWLTDRADEAVLRLIWRSALAITITVLALDVASMQGWTASPDLAAAPAETTENSPALNLPSLVPSILAPLLPRGDKRLVALPQADGVLARPMTFDLVGGGKLMASGTITPGISQIFATEVGKHGDYIKTVVLNSPGGSVTDALAMGRLIRDRKFATEVEAGKYCASSCPLVFAGGVERRAGTRAAIGVHQVAVSSANVLGTARDEMSIAQNISARCQRYLGDMGISLQVWVHAMETPHDKLFIFKTDELKSLNIVTTGATPVASPAPAAPAPSLPASKARS